MNRNRYLVNTLRLFAVVLCATARGQNIEGTVVNSITGAPIPGVSVQIKSQGKTIQTTTTDALGAFRLGGVPDGRYNAEFNKRGFDPPARDADVRQPFTVLAGASIHRLDAKMIPLGSVCGSVFDGGGNPVPEAVVDLMRGTLNGER